MLLYSKADHISLANYQISWFVTAQPIMNKEEYLNERCNMFIQLASIHTFY